MEAEAELGTEQMAQEVVAEPLFSTFDLILLAILICIATWYFTRDKKKPAATSNGKSYSIQ